MQHNPQITLWFPSVFRPRGPDLGRIYPSPNLENAAERRLDPDGWLQISFWVGSRKKASDDMTFPHPESRKDDYGEIDEPEVGKVLHGLRRRPINVTNERQGKDNVNPAKNRTLGGVLHGAWFALVLGVAKKRLTDGS